LGVFLTIPIVQTSIAKRLTDKINNETGVNLHIDKVHITISGNIIIKDFIAYDQNNDTIFYGKRLQTRIKNPWNISKDNQLLLGKTHIDNLVGKIIYYKGEKNSNLDKFIDKIDGESSDKTTGQPFKLEANVIRLTNSHFQYLDYNSSNHKVLDFNYLHTELKNFFQQSDTVSFVVKNMQMLDYRGIQIQNLTTDFLYDKHQIRLKDFQLDTDYSNIDMNLVFKSKQGGYADFNNKIILEGNIDEAGLSSIDLQKLTNHIFAGDHRFSISTKIQGSLNKLQFADFESVTDNRIELDGDFTLLKLFENQGFTIKSDIKNGRFSFAKLQQIFPELIRNNIPDELYRLGNTKIKGKLTYNKQHLYSDIIAETELGNLTMKVTMNGLDKITKTQYEGHITAKHFILKELIQQDLNNISTDFYIKGSGLNLSSLNTNFIGVVQNIDYNDYTYENITINGFFKEKLFEGQFEIADKNLEMDFIGLIDFSKVKRKLDFTSEICKANLYELNLSKDEFARFEGNIEMQAEGTNIDDITGKLSINRVQYRNQYDTYIFDNFLITSGFKEGKRDIEFKSKDIIDGYIKGVFSFKNIPVMLKNAFGSVFANYDVKPLENQQYINYKFNIHNKIVDLFNPKLKVAKNTYIKGKINSKDNLLKMRLLSPEISYNKNNLINVNLRIDNKNPLYNTFLKIDTVKTDFYTFKNIKLLNTTIKDTLYLKTKFEGGKKFNDTYDIAFYYTMDEMQNFIFGLQKSKLLFKNIDWHIDPDIDYNRIFYNPGSDSLSVENVAILHRNEKVSLLGYKTQKNLDLNIDLDSINLAHITPDLNDFDFEGLINGKVHIVKYKNEILPSTTLSIRNFKLNNEVLGDLQLKINTLPNSNVFVDLLIKKQNIQSLKLIGYVDLNKKQPELNASLLLQEFSVTPLQRLFKDIFSNIRGSMTGNVQIKGSLNDLSYNGKLYLNSFGLKVLSLNTDYQFDNRSILYLNHQTFELQNAGFFDTKYQTKGKISGIIKHHNFDNWYLDLKILTGNMLVLDTPENPQELYYGKVLVGGDARIYGYTDRLKIDANMQTKSGTYFVITLTDTENLADNDFIRIISKQDFEKEKQGKLNKNKIYEGLEMNFDLDITPDAQVEILLDQESGSTLVAKGSGAMLLEINTNGRFNIWGDFTVLEGIYNFRYSGFIDKKFNVEPGSYISWEGDPYNANLDIKAMYETFADPSVLLANQGINAKKMPVKVIIFLKDKLMHPTISFDLELPKANAILKSQVDYALSDPDKKTLQVLSLLSFGNFINENDYNLGNQAAEGLYKSISEKGLNILNALMGQDDNFQVNLNYSGGENNIEQNIVTDPQVGLSLVTKINKRVYINGKVAVPVGRYTKSSIVGDVELELYLDEAGNLVFRVFNKQTELEYLGQQEGYTQGLGVSYQVDFDTFAEILKKLGINIQKEN
jgi:hypothetical protein